MARGKKATTTEEVKVDAVVEENAAEQVKQSKEEVKETKEKASTKKEEVKVVRETVHQLGIFTDYIYNVVNKGAKVVVENLGYGDIYVDTEGLAKVGQSKRLMFKESIEFEGVEKVYLASASQPVAQILEIK